MYDSNAKRPDAASKIDLPLVLFSMLVISLSVGGLMMFPEQSMALSTLAFDSTTRLFGSTVQIVGFVCVVMIFWLACSKYGNIRLGEGKPKYGNVSWVFMFICAGLGSATMYWAFMEWAYYYVSPGLDIAPRSKEALEYSIAYSFFHWGITPWAIYGIASLAMAYHFHVRKNAGLSLSAAVEAITGLRATSVLGRSMDIIFLLATFGGLVLTITLSSSTVAKGLSMLFGFTDGYALKASLVIMVTLVFSMSSWVGIGGGMQRLAHAACGLTMAFAVVVLVLGPTGFTLNNIANGAGLMLQNFIHMSLATDPAGTGDFARGWTVFYWLYWITYTPGVALFVTRVSQGRKIKEVVFAMVLGGCGGCWLFFGSLQSFAIHQFMTGLIDSPDLLDSVGGEAVVSMLLASLPLGKVLAAIYFFLMMVFLASHLDAVAFSVAATSTRNLHEGDDPSPGLRLFWCLMLAAIPLAMLYIDAPLHALKTVVTLAAIPFVMILIIKVYGLLKWMREDYGDIPAHLIELNPDYHSMPEPPATLAHESRKSGVA
ncbi:MULTISPECIES: BCCT family transporter [Pseudomonas]|uniref:BCCT family transporter n=1 Tax=Pseudomonas monteilii TaxID=76759 RepID=A0A7X3EYM7_9PSED|nr:MULTISPECIES: BCCT family transporter [Pseudomonas]MBA6139800.1 BCCT family transporter [Pseudomonas monteilii]MCA4077103.1 BCCT family transporter [Pseudomonas kurunegalensis]MVF47889.1 BCCT family transporter [Pseudomonas monteilii]